MVEEKRLTAWSKGSGCGCKIAPAVLAEIIHGVRSGSEFANLIVGNKENDDAAVMDLGNGQCLISTVDFFTPVVDDARLYGSISAANALSDIYAMGGRPILAIAILGWPVGQLSPTVAAEVLSGARALCGEAGIPLAGGHSIESPEPFFGLSVNGLVARENLKRNTGVLAGDLLFLTKPIGTGMILAAIKRGIASPHQAREAIQWMGQLNRVGESLATLAGVRAMTDITGFGLLGHLSEMIGEERCTAEIHFSQIPLITGVTELADQVIYPDMTMKTFSAISSRVNTLGARQLLLGCDPQTSGGLLVAVAPGAVEEYREHCHQHGLPEFATQPIGRIVEWKGRAIELIDNPEQTTDR